MTPMRDWIDQLANALDLEPPSDETIEMLLGLAGAAAHASDRKAAPISCWLIGTSSLSVSQARDLVEHLAHDADRSAECTT